jgi:O-antigen/teichoic acid export membrane protein
MDVRDSEQGFRFCLPALLNFVNNLLSRSFSAKTRTASNLAANIYAVAVGLVFVPIYINYLGIEAYGIIGAFTGMTAFVWLFDLGIATNINREMAGFYESENKEDILDLKKTLEASVYIISAAIFVGLLGFVHLIAHYWLNTQRFTPDFMVSVMAILSFSLALQFPINFYQNGLMGLRQQVAINLVGISYNTIRCIGAVAAILMFDDKIRAFLIFQALAAFINLLMHRWIFQRATRVAGYKAKINFSLLQKIRKFASELFANNLVTMLLTSADKVILSRMLSLEQFGYYMIAYNIVIMTINTYSHSVNNVLFPNMVRHVNSGDTSELKRTFHLGTRVMAWGAVSIGTILVFLPEPILQLWTQNDDVVRNTAPILTLIAAAFSINITMMVPYYLQHAFGRSQVSFVFNSVSLVILIPALIFGTHYFGPVGAAMVWLVFQVAYFLTFVPVVRAKFLNFSLMEYYRDDVLRVFLFAGIIGFIIVPHLPVDGGRVEKAIIILAVFTVTCFSSFVIAGLFANEHFGALRRQVRGLIPFFRR